MAAAVLIAGACTAALGQGEDPIPPSFAPAAPTRLAIAAPETTVAPGPIVAALPAPVAEPAPQVETANRTAQPELRVASFLVGFGASHCFDEALRTALTANDAELGGAPTHCTDRDAIELMQLGRADFAVIGGNLSANDQQAGLRGTRLGVELFALAISPQSPLRSLTRHQLRQVFTGEVRTWPQLGIEGGAIVAVVPSNRALAERASRTLMPGDAFAASCLAVASERHVADQLLRDGGAVGIVSMTGQPRVDGLKLLPIDWSAPGLDTFQYQTYPYGIPVTLVTSGQPAGAAADFLAFARSPAGRELLARTMLPLQ
ncbi:MAG: substrate-binding domain-containing protein [Planctomycetota bacterium]